MKYLIGTELLKHLSLKHRKNCFRYRMQNDLLFDQIIYPGKLNLFPILSIQLWKEIFHQNYHPALIN
jgi:hypothetical protein